MYALEIDEKLVEIFERLKVKDKTQLESISKKVEQIRLNPYHFHPLRAPMQHMYHVHIDGSFVLIYTIDESRKTVVLHHYEHHDNAFEK